MMRYLFLFLILGCDLLCSPQDDVLFVSLGSNCNPGIYLKYYGFRTASYPFDWLLTIDGDRFIELLDSDFQDFLDGKYLGRHQGNLVHTYYHIEFRHDFEEIEELRAKYQRRIARFKELDQYSGKVIFIREAYSQATNPSLYWPNQEGLEISEESALRLNRAMKKLFPHLDYTLVILNSNDRDVDEINQIDDLILLNFSKFFDQKRYSEIFELLLNFSN